ncbi:cyclic nucleotide-binding domain-containing protein [Roseospira visakhapatnamensis]|uniref:ABC-type multidrug transport system fused ATPase/permease subunit n=1 Tax=Roseospira visakhapatnamensis TaxID=390880 RepID=A0A7W6R9L0_9PROT|nr:cyclic nucleotide-binding domain-containing protein [Roseospira visakhapatnamensis]MBB4264412.1 ABC-type multidrug transport system fused ATPase/permease subunit [Roseospira visakhapatnamensis]
MPPSIFRFVWSFSRGQQVRVLLLTVISFPFLYVSFEVPKRIINDAIGGGDGARSFFGLDMDQVTYLWVLCGIFLALMLINGGFKYAINVYRGVIAERMLRRLRYMLIERILRFPLPHFRSVSQGQTVAMISQESEPLGGFFGDALALPAFQGGILLTILTFMFMQDPVLGAAAIALYPIQVWLIPKLQRKVNALNKERVRTLRHMSDRIGETVSGVADIRVNNTERYELAGFSSILHHIYFIRFDIYKYKFLIKFLNNFFSQVTPFFFYAIGGYLVIRGDLSIGALVAVLAAYKDIYGPWKELLRYYQTMEDARVRYGVLIEQFAPDGMLPTTRTLAPPGASGVSASESGATSAPAPSMPTSRSRLSLTAGVVETDDGTRPVDGATLSLTLNQHVALLGHTGSGRPELAQVLAGLLPLSRGQLTLDGQPLGALPPAVMGRWVAYVDQDSYLRAGTLGEALHYGLKRAPADGAGAVREGRDRREAEMSGNAVERDDGPWSGGEGDDGESDDPLAARARRVLARVSLEDDVIAFGLRAVIDPADRPDLTEALLEARARFARDLEAAGLGDRVERFDPARYNHSASVAENLVFGITRGAGGPGGSGPGGPLAAHPAFGQALRAVDLWDEFLDIGLSLAQRMVELFRDLPPGHEFFDRFGFFDAAALDDHRRILRQAKAKGAASLSEADQDTLRGLTLALTPARHRLGLIGESLQARIVAARSTVQATLAEAAGADGIQVHGLDPERYNPAATVRVNVLFGRVAVDRPDGEERVREVLTRVLEAQDLTGPLIDLGLDTDIGIAGRRLSGSQRQKLLVARALMKRPGLLVLSGATGALDSGAREALARGARDEMAGRALVWADSEPPDPAMTFDHVWRVSGGKVVSTPSDEVEAETEVKAPSPDEAAAPPSDDKETSAIAREAAILKRLAFFAGLDLSTLKLLAFASARVVYRDGEVVMRQDEPGDVAYVIIEGTAQVVLEVGGDETIIAERGPGDLVGELALLCEAPRTATVRAKGTLEVLRISGEVFVRLIEDNTQVGAVLTRTIAKRLETVMRQMGQGARK